MHGNGQEPGCQEAGRSPDRHSGPTLKYRPRRVCSYVRRWWSVDTANATSLSALSKSHPPDLPKAKAKANLPATAANWLESQPFRRAAGSMRHREVAIVRFLRRVPSCLRLHHPMPLTLQQVDGMVYATAPQQPSRDRTCKVIKMAVTPPDAHAQLMHLREIRRCCDAATTHLDLARSTVLHDSCPRPALP